MPRIFFFSPDRCAPIAVISPETEVWLDLVPDEDGVAVVHTRVPFLPDPGVNSERSIVIHVEATDEHAGVARARQACLPLVTPSMVSPAGGRDAADLERRRERAPQPQWARDCAANARGAGQPPLARPVRYWADAIVSSKPGRGRPRTRGTYNRM